MPRSTTVSSFVSTVKPIASLGTSNHATPRSTATRSSAKTRSMQGASMTARTPEANVLSSVPFRRCSFEPATRTCPTGASSSARSWVREKSEVGVVRKLAIGRSGICTRFRRSIETRRIAAAIEDAILKTCLRWRTTIRSKGTTFDFMRVDWPKCMTSRSEWRAANCR